MVEELTEDHKNWVIREGNVFNLGAKELRVVLDAMKVYMTNSVTPKKKN